MPAPLKRGDQDDFARIYGGLKVERLKQKGMKRRPRAGPLKRNDQGDEDRGDQHCKYIYNTNETVTSP